MSLAIGTHFCCGKTVETKVLIGDTHLECNMQDMEEPCDDSEKPYTDKVHLENHPCCENEYQTVQGTDVFLKEVAQQSFNINFAIALIYTNLNLELLSKSTAQFSAEYITPPLERDIQVLFQRFLI